MMRKVKKLKAKIEKLERDLCLKSDENLNLKMKIMGDDAYRESLKKEIVKAQNKYVEEVQKNVALADIIVGLRQKLDEAKECGYCDAD